MCLIIAPGEDGKKALLPREVFDYVYNRNNDGFGAMWVEDGRVGHFKTLDLKGDEIYGMMEEYTERYPDVIFHMRYKTHGKIIPGLSHPFRILHKSRHGKDLFFMHNGVLGGFGNNLNYGQSDTTVFKDKILVPLLTRNPDALDDPETMAALNKLTSGSRLIFLDSEGKTWFTGESSWNERYGLKLSNDYMLPYESRPTQMSTIGKTTGSTKTTTTGQFIHFRKIEQLGKSKGFWCSIPREGFVRTESGQLYKDAGTNKTIYHELDLIKKEDEHKHLAVVYRPVTDDELNDDVPLTLVEPLEDDEPFDDDAYESRKEEGPAPLDQRLRYARLCHNLFGGTVTSREQLMADLIGMGEEELGDFVSEDSVNAHTVIAELVEMILEYNDELFKVDLKNEKIMDAEELMERADINYHQQAMKDITELRRAEYAEMIEKKKDEGKGKKAA